MENPCVILVFSGKRKSGKDYITDLLHSRLGNDVCAILRLSEPLKRQYAVENGLDLSRLLDSSEYKEKYRKDMILWGEKKRNEDPDYFCQLATSVREADQRDVWFISDARRLSDVSYFKRNYKNITLTVRVNASDAVRQDRGFIFKPGVDDAESECGLDNYGDWDFVIQNDGPYNSKPLEEAFEQTVKKLLDIIHTKLKIT